MANRKSKVKINVSKSTRTRLKHLKSDADNFDVVINRIIDYIEFHPEYWSRRI